MSKNTYIPLADMEWIVEHEGAGFTLPPRVAAQELRRLREQRREQRLADPDDENPTRLPESSDSQKDQKPDK